MLLEIDLIESVWFSAIAVVKGLIKNVLHIGILIINRNTPNKIQIGDWLVTLPDTLAKQGRTKVATEIDLEIIE